MRTVTIQDLASECPRFGSTVGKCYQLLKRTVVDYRIGIQNENVLAAASSNTDVISGCEPEISTILDYLNTRVVVVNEFYRAVGRAVVGDDHLKIDISRFTVDGTQTITDHF
jgi:hypothetical protein